MRSGRALNVAISAAVNHAVMTNINKMEKMTMLLLLVFLDDFAVAGACRFAIKKCDLSGNDDDFYSGAEGARVSGSCMVLNGFRVKDCDIGNVVWNEFASIFYAKCSSREGRHFSNCFGKGNDFTIADIATENSWK